MEECERYSPSDPKVKSIEVCNKQPRYVINGVLKLNLLLYAVISYS